MKMIDFQEWNKYDFLFPIWATEQHWPFIPFGTDTYVTQYLVNQISIEFPDLIILPTLEFSRSQEHREFYGTIWLYENTFQKVMYDVCNSLKAKAKNIFIISFHFNDPYIKKFIQNTNFEWVNIIHLEILNNEDDNYIKKNILNGELDWHAGNTEISNMLIIDEKLVKVPSKDYPKTKVENPFETDNLFEKCPNGIADNHPDWITNKDIGKKILDIYEKRIIKNIKNSF